jgi:hypothetical protein
MGTWTAWHTPSIGLALSLFPKPGSNFGLVVLVLGIRSPFRETVDVLKGPGEGVGDEGDEFV